MPLFDGTTNTDNVIDPEKDYFEELTKPGAKFDKTKYASEDDLKKAIGRSKAEADLYISELVRKQDEMRDDLVRYKSESETRPRLEDLLTKLETSFKTNELPPQNHLEDNGNKALDAKAIEDMVVKQMTEREVQRIGDDNESKVEAKLREKMGDNFATTLRMKAKSLGIDESIAMQLARRSPDAFFNMFGLNEKTETFQAPPRSSRNESFTPTGSPKRTWSWYQNFRKENPEAYYSAKWTLQRIDDAASLGTAFEDGNYNS